MGKVTKTRVGGGRFGAADAGNLMPFGQELTYHFQPDSVASACYDIVFHIEINPNGWRIVQGGARSSPFGCSAGCIEGLPLLPRPFLLIFDQFSPKPADMLSPTRLFFMIALMTAFHGMKAQDSTATNPPSKPDQLDIFKINLLQFAVNEARVSYEFQIGRTTSLELGAGYIYPNKFWYERSGSVMLSSGGGLYLGFRKYFDPKRYIYQPFFRSYVSIHGFARSTSFEDEWLLFGSDRYGFQCELFSMQMKQFGGGFRIGFQSRAGRLVLDLYTGIGMKIVPTVTTSHALNDSSSVCAILPTTQIREIQMRNQDVEVVLNAGVNVGIRRNNRERAYMQIKREEPLEIPDTPAQF